jgi:antitoxin (DNA-binding transcriptional repressor) of toxin-antitoxin stability system
MATVTVENAQAHLAELIDGLRPGEEVVIARNEKPVARLVAESAPEATPRRLGTLKGSVLYMAPDFDAPLDDPKESLL